MSEADDTRGSCLVLVFQVLEAQRPCLLIHVSQQLSHILKNRITHSLSCGEDQVNQERERERDTSVTGVSFPSSLGLSQGFFTVALWTF